MSHQIRHRLKWIRLYEQTGNAGLVCLRCGISRPTLRLWYRRYVASGESGLEDKSRRPNCSPVQKVSQQIIDWILALRKRRLGARRIRSELLRQYNCSLSLATIHKVLVAQGKNVLDSRRMNPKGKSVISDRFQVNEFKWTFVRLDQAFINIQLLMIAQDTGS